MKKVYQVECFFQGFGLVLSADVCGSVVVPVVCHLGPGMGPSHQSGSASQHYTPLSRCVCLVGPLSSVLV